MHACHPHTLAARAKGFLTSMRNAFLISDLLSGTTACKQRIFQVKEVSEIRDQPALCKGCKLPYISILMEAAAQVK